MAGEHFYISDLHLSPRTREINALFELFLERHAKQAAALTINGDLFNAYFGFKQLKNRFYRGIAYKLRELVRAGVRVDFVAGNRDFLFTEDAFAFGMRGYADEVYRQLLNERVSAIHGDSFCLDDRGYLRFRRFMRAMPWRKANYIAPAFVGAMIAGTFRTISKLKRASTGKKRDESYFDIKDIAVVNFIRRVGCDTVVCGHIHKPQERVYALRGRDARMLVLSDWSRDGAVIARGEGGKRLELAYFSEAGIEPWPHEIKRYEIHPTTEQIR